MLNLLFISTILLALLLGFVGNRIYPTRFPRFSLLLGAMAVLAAMPGVGFVAYYAHMLDGAGWLYRFRALPGSELAGAGMGFGAGVAMSVLRRGVGRGRSRGFVRSVSGLLAFTVALLLLAPYAKPLVAPLRIDLRDHWRDGVCLQSTPSTCGPASAATLLRRFGRSVSERELAKECYTYGGGTESWYLMRALRNRGLQVDLKLTPPQPAAPPFPSIAGTQIGGPGGSGHFICILGQQEGRLLIGDPIGGRYLLTPQQMRSKYYLTGFFLCVNDPSHSVLGEKTTATEELNHLHGAVQILHYKSRTFRTMRRMHIYTPPGYDPRGALHYPVLYLLHGSPGDDGNWSTGGYVNSLFDELITTRQCPPCIVVMPNNEFRRRRYGHRGFEFDLFADIMPLIETTYRVQTEAASRAIAGFSMGGFYALEIGLNHLDKFGWIGVYSAGFRPGFLTEADITGLNAGPEMTEQQLKLLYICIGKRDFFLPDARRLDRWLTQKSVPHFYQEVEGGHEWPVWQRALADFAPRLFTSIGK